MTLDNLLRIGQLKQHATDRAEIVNLIAAARRNLADAGVEKIKVPRTASMRHTSALCSRRLVALMANGFRPDTKIPGHHRTVIQSLPKTIGLAAERMTVLDTLRNKRNLSDYTGKEIDPASLAVCIEEAKQLLDDVVVWLAANHSELSP